MASAVNTNVHQTWSNARNVQSYAKRRWAVLDLNVSYDLNDHTTFYFKALNLTNQHYSVDESQYYYGVKQVHPQSGRQFIYGVDFKF